ncbi:MAG: BolA family protein [Rhodocyclaceae bacterium]|jgi:BolA protein|nr:BolA family protein [Rhodocyclaceae bacterium]
MTSVPAQMRERLAALAPTQMEIGDDSALHAGHAGARLGGGHFRLTIVSPRFAGLNTVARHRLVYATLGDMMKREIHALVITAQAPEEV